MSSYNTHKKNCALSRGYSEGDCSAEIPDAPKCRTCCDSVDISNERFVTITFDDGLLAGANKAVEVMSDFGARGVFYVVTGWVRPRSTIFIRDVFNRGRDHGSWDDWRRIQDLGHEVGSHTVSHLNAGGRLVRWIPFLLQYELRRARAVLEKQLHRSPVALSMPWNVPAAGADERTLRQLYPACRLGGNQYSTNNLQALDWQRLTSWAPDSDVPVQTILEAIRATPAGHWHILQFHSFDDEGYMPITKAKFRSLLQGIADTGNLRQVTIAEMLNEKRTEKGRISVPLSEHLP